MLPLPPLVSWDLPSLFNLTLFFPSIVVQPFWMQRIPNVTRLLHGMEHVCEALWSSGCLLLWCCCACLLGINIITMLMPMHPLCSAVELCAKLFFVPLLLYGDIFDFPLETDVRDNLFLAVPRMLLVQNQYNSSARVLRWFARWSVLWLFFWDLKYYHVILLFIWPMRHSPYIEISLSFRSVPCFCLGSW